VALIVGSGRLPRERWCDTIAAAVLEGGQSGRAVVATIANMPQLNDDGLHSFSAKMGRPRKDVGPFLSGYADVRTPLERGPARYRQLGSWTQWRPRRQRQNHPEHQQGASRTRSLRVHGVGARWRATGCKRARRIGSLDDDGSGPTATKCAPAQMMTDALPFPGLVSFKGTLTTCFPRRHTSVRARVVRQHIRAVDHRRCQ